MIYFQDIDTIISSEILDPNFDLELYKIITRQMVHGPCSIVKPQAPCMKNGQFEKGYPKHFINETKTEVTGYTLYRKRSPENGGRTAITAKNKQTYTIDNRWIVPYSPVLSKAFKGHINVELCHHLHNEIY